MPHRHLQDIRVCMELKRVSEPFNGGGQVEIRFDIPRCDNQGIISGDLRLIVPVSDFDLHGMVGDRKMLRIRNA